MVRSAAGSPAQTIPEGLDNSMMKSMLFGQSSTEAAGESPVAEVLPSWSTNELKAIQRELQSRGFYDRRIDGVYGDGTGRGLDRAIGIAWRSLTPAEIYTQVHALPLATKDAEPVATAAPTATQVPAWNRADLEAIQKELRARKLYDFTVDGLYGRRTQTGLDAAFGSDAWRTMAPAALLAQLKALPGGSSPAEQAPVEQGPTTAPTTEEVAQTTVTNSGGGDLTQNPTWSAAELKEIQRELRRLGLYDMTVDGVFGKGSAAGLFEAFGSNRWRGMDAASTLRELNGAPTPASAGKQLRYAEMFKDGVLDITLGVGFDEGGYDAVKGFRDVLTSRNFKEDAGMAADIYKAAGRDVANSDFGMYFVQKGALTYTPPVGGEPRSVDAVVRLVSNSSGRNGAAASGAFKEGMVESDVAYYSGHGRYGSGPDFDRNMSFELLDGNGKVERSITDYTVLEKALKQEGQGAGRTAWQQFQWRDSNHRIKVNGSNDGNVFLNDTNSHSGEFGANLMYWNLRRTGGQGAKLQTGAAGGLAAMAQNNDDAQDYRVLVFDGCRTKDYVQSVRGTPGMDKNSNDIMATTRTVNWGDEIGTLAKFLDGIIGQQSAKNVIEGMDAEQHNSNGTSGNAYKVY